MVDNEADILKELGLIEEFNGQYNLNEPMNKGDIAVLITKLHGEYGEVTCNPAAFAHYCKFKDVPPEYRPYVGFCVKNQIFNGKSINTFGTSDIITVRTYFNLLLKLLGHNLNDPFEIDWYAENEKLIGFGEGGDYYDKAVNKSDIVYITYNALEKLEALYNVGK
jgi:hypothetical protein